MNSLIFFTLSLACIGATRARMPADLTKFLGLSEEPVETKATMQEEIDTLLGSDFNLNHYNSPSNMASIETAFRKLGAGDVEQYMPRPVGTVECHVEFQVTERVPGRCTKLAGNIPACQTPKYIGINYHECN